MALIGRLFEIMRSGAGIQRGTRASAKSRTIAELSFRDTPIGARFEIASGRRNVRGNTNVELTDAPIEIASFGMADIG
jgi:hypothetical protein